MRTRTAEHAIVVGASMAGLANAAALAKRFERVTVVERDVLPAAPEQRRGVPQGRHVHALLPGGLEHLADLLPGIVEELRAEGARQVNPDGLRFHIGGGRIYPADYGRPVISATRPLVEAVVRRRVRALPGVRFVEGCDACGLVTTADRRRVTGVRLLPRTDSSAEETLAADLVVDATGRGARSPRWLADLGYAPPPEERINVGVHYVTRLFRRDPRELGGWQQVLVTPVPGRRRGAVASVVEEGRWIVTLGGFLGERPPTDLDGFVDYATTLWAGDISILLAGAEPLGDASTTTYPASTRRRYDRLERFPEGYVVTGDAVCSFNPVYGQGMSVAAWEATRLGQVLDRHGLRRVGPRFFRSSRRIVDTAWTLATDSDLADPGVEGPRTARWRFVRGYLDRLLPVAHRDPVVARAFLDVVGMVEPPESLMRPRVAWRVLRDGRPPAVPADIPGEIPVPAASSGSTLPG